MLPCTTQSHTHAHAMNTGHTHAQLPVTAALSKRQSVCSSTARTTVLQASHTKFVTYKTDVASRTKKMATLKLVKHTTQHVTHQQPATTFPSHKHTDNKHQTTLQTTTCLCCITEQKPTQHTLSTTAFKQHTSIHWNMGLPCARNTGVQGWGCERLKHKGVCLVCNKGRVCRLTNRTRRYG
jgi:hypothetical protein